MPISLIPDSSSRRSFLKAASLSACAVPLFGAAKTEEAIRPWYALLADTHIDANPATIARGINLTDHLKRVVAEVLAEPTVPEFLIINGDCAYLKGRQADYQTLRPLLRPLLDVGIPVHLTMGNHDDRTPFYELFPEAKKSEIQSETHHLAVIETPLANWFLLDSLQQVNNVTGEIGKAQREWLAAEIDRRGDTPAIIVGHHNPQVLPKGSSKKITGIADTQKLLDLWHTKPQVKLYFFGHTHRYEWTKTMGGIHLLNQPPVAYVFDKKRPNGWLRAEVTQNSLVTELRALDKKHPEHGGQRTLAWR